jgi:hypothetical protein
MLTYFFELFPPLIGCHVNNLFSEPFLANRGSTSGEEKIDNTVTKNTLCTPNAYAPLSSTSMHNLAPSPILNIPIVNRNFLGNPIIEKPSTNKPSTITSSTPIPPCPCPLSTGDLLSPASPTSGKAEIENEVKTEIREEIIAKVELLSPASPTSNELLCPASRTSGELLNPATSGELLSPASPTSGEPLSLATPTSGEPFSLSTPTLVPSVLPGTSAPSSGIDKAWPLNENSESELPTRAAGQPKPPSAALGKSNTNVNPNVVVSAHPRQGAKTAQERSILFWSNSAERAPSVSKEFQTLEDVTIKNGNWYRDPKQTDRAVWDFGGQTKEAEKEASNQRDQSQSLTNQSPTSTSTTDSDLIHVYRGGLHVL